MCALLCFRIFTSNVCSKTNLTNLRLQYIYATQCKSYRRSRTDGLSIEGSGWRQVAQALNLHVGSRIRLRYNAASSTVHIKKRGHAAPAAVAPEFRPAKVAHLRCQSLCTKLADACFDVVLSEVTLLQVSRSPDDMDVGIVTQQAAGAEGPGCAVEVVVAHGDSRLNIPCKETSKLLGQRSIPDRATFLVDDNTRFEVRQWYHPSPYNSGCMYSKCFGSNMTCNGTQMAVKLASMSCT